MKNLLLIILALSVAFQCMAAFMAIRLIRISGGLAAWILLSCAFLLMGVRRAVTLLLSAAEVSQAEIGVEVIGLLVSLLLVVGVSQIAALFRRLKEANLEVIKGKDELAAKQLQLEALNRTLEERVDEAVAEVRAKDELMISQSRRAAMGEMISYIAHQWKHPLNNLGLVMQGAQQEYERNLLTPEQMSQYTEKGMEILDYMSHTIDDFRDFFREDRVKRPFSIAECVSRAMSLVEASLKDNKIGIDFDCGTDVQVMGYCNEYAQVLLNLLGNARDALMERSIPEPAIRIRCFVEGGNCVVTVADNAGGIPEEHMERIFDLYFTTKEEAGGSGLGLFMARTIIEKNMGGSLSARNVAGGAEFRMEIPLR